MVAARKPFQGTWNIIRFNWHFYVFTAVMITLVLALNFVYSGHDFFLLNIIYFLVVAATLISLLVSLYIYDLSGLYELKWLNEISIEPTGKIVNINAGFDETSSLLQHKFPFAELQVFDFYDPVKHTEVSIKRARKAYPPYKGTMQVNTSHIPVANNSVDNIFLIFAAHEIRNDEERNIFFKELGRALKNSGKVIVTEHLRDLPNFLAYNIGFFHFISRSSWYSNFKAAGLTVTQTINITPFITTFILEKNGTTS